ncbi:ylyB [Symbiodinium sp. CCMP2592]|nr:ylyB [Symbiodinium sp. CCMP2592]
MEGGRSRSFDCLPVFFLSDLVGGYAACWARRMHWSSLQSNHVSFKMLGYLTNMLKHQRTAIRILIVPCIRKTDSDDASEASTEQAEQVDTSPDGDGWRKLLGRLLLKDSDACLRQHQQMKHEALWLSHLAGTWRDSYGAVGRFHADSLVMIEDGETSAVKVRQATSSKASILVLLYGDFWEADADLQTNSLSWSTGELWEKEPRGYAGC